MVRTGKRLRTNPQASRNRRGDEVRCSTGSADSFGRSSPPDVRLEAKRTPSAVFDVLCKEWVGAMKSEK